jgi:aspartyl-tRNA(Asn)/glutamyl-tRNA(Gln) amidotransferase subunit B
MTKYTPIIGLEVHAELKTNSKMFCGCKNDPFGAEKPNIYTCPVCLGLPGALPVPNQKAIEWTIKTGLALNCQINLFSKFDRKNYFYPDLAKGYQISQYDIPFCHSGFIQTHQGKVRIRRIHLEEDTGKLLHDKIKGEAVSLIDFNRSGVPLIEIVTEPDIKNGAQAKDYGRKLRQVLRYLDVADCRMAEGGMRLEANISLQADGQTELPDYKVEIKNINSFRFLEQAIEFEIERQTKILEAGKIPAQETRGWNADKEKTFAQRSKETAEDYRYFPDPDIPPIKLTQEQIEKLKAEIPELPSSKTKRWMQTYQLDANNAELLAANKNRANWAEAIFKLAQQQKISPNEIAKDIVNKKIDVDLTDKAQSVLDKYQKLHEITEVAQDELESIIQQVLSNNPDVVKKYRKGQTQVLGFLMGQVMQEFKQKIDPQQVRQELQNVLDQN